MTQPTDTIKQLLLGVLAGILFIVASAVILFMAYIAMWASIILMLVSSDPLVGLGFLALALFWLGMGIFNAWQQVKEGV
jgi:hypothetical protein